MQTGRDAPGVLLMPWKTGFKVHQGSTHLQGAAHCKAYKYGSYLKLWEKVLIALREEFMPIVNVVGAGI